METDIDTPDTLPATITAKGFFHKAAYLLLLCCILLLPLLYSESVREIAILPRYALLGLVSPLIFALILLHIYRSNTRLVWSPLFTLAVLLLAWSALSYLWSEAPVSTIQDLTKLASLLFLGISTMQLSRNIQDAQWILVVSGLAAVPISIIGILQYYGYNPLDYMQYAPPAATFGNKNFAAMYLDFIVPVTFVLIFLATKRLHIWAAAGMFGISLTYLILIHSRASWLGLAVVCGILLFMLFRFSDIRRLFSERIRLRLAPLLTALLIPFVMLAIPAATDSPANLLEAKRELGLDLGMEIRLRAYANALEMIKEAPVAGYGLGSFMIAFRPFMFAAAPLTLANETLYLVNLHNDLLQIFVELGVVGGILAIALFVFAIYSVFRLTTSRDLDTAHRLMGLGLLLAFLAFSVHALFSFPIHRPNSVAQLWIFLGISAGIVHGSMKKPESFAIPGWLVFTLFSLTAVFISLAAFHYSDAIKNSIYTKEMDIALREDRCDAALETAGKVEPFNNYDSFVLYPFAFIKCDAKADIALTPMSRIIQYAPYNAMARYKRGYLYLKTGQPDLALEDFLVVIQVLPHRYLGYHGVADTAVTAGNIPLAIKMYQKVLEIEPESPSARQMLQRLAPQSAK